MEMGVECYNISFSNQSNNFIRSNMTLVYKYIILLPFQLIENQLYQTQGKHIIRNYLINEHY